MDESGHCWGVASFIRGWNIDTPWGTIGGGTNCANIDTALQLVQNPDVPVEDRIIPAAVVGGFGVATLYGAVGATGLACSAAAPCAKAAETALGIGTAASADGNPTNEVKLGLDAFSRTSEFGIKTFNELGRLTRGTGLERHHIVEQRFARTLGVEKGNMPSIALTPKEHQVFTNAWRDAIAYSNSGRLPNTITATADDIWQAAQRIYRDYPILTEAAKLKLFWNQ